jgi:hypothetical protein
VFDEAKEATKEAAKRVSKDAAKEAARLAREAAKDAARPARDAAREAAREAARPAKEAAREAAMLSTSIVNSDVICCGRANCQQGTQKYTGALWTHQFGKRKQIWCASCKKNLEASKWVVVAA